VFSFASPHSPVVNAQNSVLQSKVLEWSKSKNRKVERFAHCETDFTSAYCVTFSNGRKFGRGEQQLQQNVSHAVNAKDRTHNRCSHGITQQQVRAHKHEAKTGDVMDQHSTASSLHMCDCPFLPPTYANNILFHCQPQSLDPTKKKKKKKTLCTTTPVQSTRIGAQAGGRYQNQTIFTKFFTG
jgi:hypothetical protein